MTPAFDEETARRVDALKRDATHWYEFLRFYGDRFVYYDCRRCGAIAFPTTGYCSRWCKECDAYDSEGRARLGLRRNHRETVRLKNV
jgi:uncharacterized OB-fold protein